MQNIDTNSSQIDLDKPIAIQILVIKISHDAKFLALGKNNGEIMVFEFLNFEYFQKNDKLKINDYNYFNLINDIPLNKFNHQKKEIIEICWSYKVHYLYFKIIFNPSEYE